MNIFNLEKTIAETKAKINRCTDTRKKKRLESDLHDYERSYKYKLRQKQQDKKR